MVIMPVLNLDKYTKKQQLEKIAEEFIEVGMALAEKEDDERVIEESFDLIQATVGLMLKVASKEQIKLIGTKNYQKLKNRDWELKGLIKVAMDWKEK